MPKIAIIEDDPDIVEATTIILENKGYDIVTAANVQDALVLVKEEIPDLILLDVMLDEPDDGFYLANKFRKEGINTPIIMMTSIAKVTGFDFGRSDMLPIDEFMEKPVQPKQLLDNIEKILKQREGGGNAGK